MQQGQELKYDSYKFKRRAAKAVSLFYDLSVGEIRSLGMRFLGLKKRLHLQVDGTKTVKGDFVVVVSL